ncbi:MAG: choice-of-anchor D domain-containing protein [Acidobacteriaceae bacterium]
MGAVLGIAGCGSGQSSGSTGQTGGGGTGGSGGGGGGGGGGGPAGTVAYAPAQYAFPDQVIGTTSAPTNVTLTNGQSTALAVTSIQVPPPFSQTNTCGASVAAGAACTIAVTFTPSALGAANAALTISDSGAGSPRSVALSGNGVKPVNTGGSVSYTPTQIAFPDLAVGGASAPATVTLTNGQSIALNIAAIQVAAPFSQTNTCGTVLAPSASCTITVTFSPAAVGPSSANLTITDDGAGSPRTVALTGNGIASGGLSVVPKIGGLTFYNQIVNTSSTPLPVTLTNNQSSAVSIASITSSAEFPFTTSCTDSTGTGMLAGGASCTINVSFLPQALGARSAILTISASVAGSPLALPLAGIGIAGDPGVAVTVAPYQPCALPSGTQQFSATVSGTTNTAVSWGVDAVPGGSPATGTITPAGLYTAPATAGSHYIRAVSQDPSQAVGSTLLQVTGTPLFTIYPFASSLSPGGQQSFQAQLCHVPESAAVTWTVDNIPGGNATVGTVTSQGVYTAPPTTGHHTVQVTDTALSKSSTAGVTVYSNISVDFGSRTNIAHPIPANLFGYGRAESIHTDADRNLITQAGVTVARLYANFPGVYATTTPDWTQIDPFIQSILNAGQRPLIQMAQSPPFLQANPNPCGAGDPSVPPADFNAWGQLAASYVAHFDATFPGMVQDYEIWNEPNAKGLCAASGDQLTNYMAIYAAAAPLMKQQAAADAQVIHLGGPALSTGYAANWIQALLSTPSTAPYVDFISYHQYPYGPGNLNVQWDTYNGNTSLYQEEQSTNTGASSIYNQVYALAQAGKQPLGAQTPIEITEYSTNFSFFKDCCRNDPTYAPLWNALYISDMLNNAYESTSPSIPGRLVYFAGSAYPYFCLIGVQDANSDCLYSAGATPVPYPQYYTYQLLASPTYLGLVSGGYLAASISPPISDGGIAVTAFYDATQDAILITNPTASSYPAMPVVAQNLGLTSPQATLFQIVNGQSINSSSVALTAQGATYTATIAVPPYSVQAISLKGQ